VVSTRQEYLSKLIICIAIACTSAIFQEKEIKNMSIQEYVARLEKKYRDQRRHSNF
jgi:uncharacterized membrane protein